MNRKTMNTLVQQKDGQLHKGMVYNTPILCKINDTVQYKYINDIVLWKNDREQSIVPNNIFVWSGQDGWVKMLSITRYKTDCSIMQILTQTSIIELTSNHPVFSNTELVHLKNIKSGDLLDGASVLPDLHVDTDMISVLSSASTHLDLATAHNLIVKNGFHVHIELDDGVCMLNIDESPLFNEVKHITEIGKTNEYVYQLDTNGSQFVAGIGTLFV